MPMPMYNRGSILPDILDVAIEHGVQIGQTLRSRPNETRANCPFCGDDRKYHLYVNTDKQVFKCYRCSASGGVIKFIAKLENTSEHNVLEDLKEKAKKENPINPKQKTIYQTYPGLRLNVFQLRLIGYEYRPNWNEFFQKEPTLAKEYANAVWNKWQRFLELEQILAMRTLYLALYAETDTYSYSEGVSKIRGRSKEIGYDLLTPCLNAYSNNKPPKWYKEAERQALSWMFGCLGIQKKKEIEESENRIIDGKYHR